MTHSVSSRLSTGLLGVAGLAQLAVFTAALALLGGATGQAGSLGRPCTTAPRSAWLSVEDLQSRVEALGYKVQKAKVKNACGEFYARDRNGAGVELFVDPATGDIVDRL